MKKILISLVMIILLATSASASIIVQTQANTMGTGFGLGYSMTAIPVVMDLGIEANAASSPWLFKDKGSYTDSVTKTRVDYEGSLFVKGKRYGVFAKFNLLIFSFMVHAGAQEADLTLDGSLGNSEAGVGIDEATKLYGSYYSIGFPFYLGPVFMEAQFGSQSIYIPHYTNIQSIGEFQISAGLSFL